MAGRDEHPTLEADEPEPIDYIDAAVSIIRGSGIGYLEAMQMLHDMARESWEAANWLDMFEGYETRH